MGNKRAAGPLNTVSVFSGSVNTFHPYSNSSKSFEPPKWVNGAICRVFRLGDLVTLAPEFRYSIATNRPDFGRYVGIIVREYSNREYLVHWTNQPLINGIEQGMFNGDHLILIEHAQKALMKK